MKAFVRRLRTFSTQLVPHGYLALLLIVDGLMLLRPVAENALRQSRGSWYEDWITLINAFGVLALPQAVIAAGLATMAIGIALRARVAW
ncbi:MAG: voltage-gated potassium channel TrkA, partial [Paraburkholderia sp.]|nr:voltage-gated potassium channel TrkA [Paraburkholderia sp.]